MAETLSDYQKDILVRTILGEARGEGLDGMEAVAQVIRNRSSSGRFPDDPAEVALQPSQFSVWNAGAGGGKTNYSKNSDLYKKAEQAVDRVFSGQAPDRTNGALFYHTPSVSPNWSSEANKYGTTQLGNHIFYNGRPTPPGEIPDQVASLTDTVAPRIPPNPVAMSPDLSLMRNPQMSSAAMNAQVTPSSNTPLPRPRPSAPDIVTPSMASLARPTGNVNATRGVDMLATTQNPVTPRLTAAGDNIYSYHIPDMTPTTVTGGLGSLTPTPARARLPELPQPNIGQPPTTRVVQSVPFNMTPASSMPRPTSAQVNDAARRASLMGTQSNVERAIPTQPIMPTSPMGSASGNIIEQRAEQLGLRPAASARLMPGVAAQNYDVALNGPPGLTSQQFGALPFPGSQSVGMGAPGFGGIQIVPPAMPRRIAPMPMAASMRPMMPIQQAPRPQRIVPQPMARMVQAASPLRVVVNGANSYGTPSQSQGQSAPRQIQGYVNDGNGKLTSTETGGVYYERHLR